MRRYPDRQRHAVPHRHHADPAVGASSGPGHHRGGHRRRRCGGRGPRRPRRDTTDGTEPTDGTVASERVGRRHRHHRGWRLRSPPATSCSRSRRVRTGRTSWCSRSRRRRRPAVSSRPPSRSPYALAERLGVEVEPLVPTDYAGVIVALQSGQAQIAGGLGPVQMVQAEDEAGAELILQSERFGEFVYVTQWFTNDPDTYCEDAPGRRPGDRVPVLQRRAPTRPARPTGRSARSTSPTSPARRSPSSTRARRRATSCRRCSCSMPASTRSRTSRRCSPAATTRPCRPCTTATPPSACRSTTPASELVEQIPDVGEKVVVFAWSFPIPNDGFAVAGDLPPDLKEAITAALHRHRRDAEGQAMLQELYEIDGLRPGRPRGLRRHPRAAHGAGRPPRVND